MKKMVVILVGILYMLMLTSCSENFKRMCFSEEYDNKLINNIIAAIESKDVEKLEELYAPNAVAECEDFEESVKELFDFYKGEMISFEGNTTGGSKTFDTYDSKTIWYEYKIKTDEDVYIAIFIYNILDEFDADNEGLYYISIIREEDDNEYIELFDEEGVGINIVYGE